MRRLFSRTRSTRGSSIVENVVAIGITMVAAAGGITVYAAAVDTQGGSRAANEAVEIARSDLNRFRTLPVARVQLVKGDYDQLMATGERRILWQQYQNGAAQGRTDTGVVRPFELTGPNDNYRIMRYVDCSVALNSAGECVGSPAPTRTVRVVVEGPGNMRVQTATVIGRPNASGSPTLTGAGSTIAPPGGLVATQVADSAIQVQWNPGADAASYRITRNGAFVADTINPNHLISDQALLSDDATTDNTICVRARNAARAASAPACITLLTRPTGLSATRPGTGTNLSWMPNPKKSGIAGYRVERKRSYERTVMASNPIAYWRFNESQGATTAVSTADRPNDLTYIAGPTLGVESLTSDRDDRAARFAWGPQSAYRAGTLDGWNNANFTISAWVTIDAFPSRGAIIKIGGITGAGGCDGTGVGLGWGGTNFDNDGRQLIGLYECVRWIPSGWEFPRAGTYHVIMTVNSAGTAEFFVNGSFVGSSPGAVPLAPVNGTSVGGYNSRDFAGALDDIAVFPSVLASATIVEHYRSGRVDNDILADGPIGYWNLGDSGVSVPDRTGNGRTLTVNGTSTTSVAADAPFIGESVRTMGTTNWGSLSASPDLRAKPFTISMWVRPTSYNGSSCLYELVSAYAAGQANYLCWHTDGRLRAGFLNTELSTTATFALNQWHHIVVTHAGPSAGNLTRIFVNGVLRAESSSIGNLSGTTASALRFNRWNGGAGFAGQWGEVVVYPYAFSMFLVPEFYNRRADLGFDSGWTVLSSLQAGATHADTAGICGDRYRVRAYKTTPARGMVEGTDYATSRVVSAC